MSHSFPSVLLSMQIDFAFFHILFSSSNEKIQLPFEVSNYGNAFIPLLAITPLLAFSMLKYFFFHCLILWGYYLSLPNFFVKQFFQIK